MKPLVSVCVASYNQAEFVCDTLDSIVGQTYRPIEIIIVDDCSKDSSVAVIKSWLASRSSDNKVEECKIQLHEKKVNSGICSTFNIALQNAKGKYISIIGTDDIMLPEKIEHQVALLEKAASDVGLVYSDAYLIDAEGAELFGRFIQLNRPHTTSTPQGSVFDFLIEGNYIPVMSILWKKECFDVCGNFDESLIYEDYDMLLRISLKYKFVFSDFISVKYRLHNSNFHNRLRSLAGLESDFAIFYKYADSDGQIRPRINVKLMQFLEGMAMYKSHNLLSYLTLYNKKFPENKTVGVAITYHLPYKWLLGIHNISKVTRKYFF
jgi:glycosyltransferase involved in cell wall biosynthesis